MSPAQRSDSSSFTTDSSGFRQETRRGKDRHSKFRSLSQSPSSSEPPPPVYSPPPLDAPQGAMEGLATLEPMLKAMASAMGMPDGQQLLKSLFAYCQPAAAMAGNAPLGMQAMSMPMPMSMPISMPMPMPMPMGVPGFPAPTTPASGIGVYSVTLEEPNQSTPEISTNELRRILSQGSAYVFDTRTRLEYAIGHIPGALNVAPKPEVPMSQYVSDVAEIQRIVQSAAAPIVLYCNGPFCGKSRRLGDELVDAGFTNVRRYQLGTPVWRALMGTMAIEPDGINYILDGDRTAALIDARSAEQSAKGTVRAARNIPIGEVVNAKDDGRLPMDDFNTRVVVFGEDGPQAQSLAEVLVQQGFNNVKFFEGTFGELLKGLR